VQGPACSALARTSTKRPLLPGVQALLHVSEKQAGLPNQREHTTVAQRVGGIARLQAQMAPRARPRTAPTPLAAFRAATLFKGCVCSSVQQNKLFWRDSELAAEIFPNRCISDFEIFQNSNRFVVNLNVLSACRTMCRARGVAFADDSYIYAALKAALKVLVEIRQLLGEDAKLCFNMTKVKIYIPCVSRDRAR